MKMKFFQFLSSQ